MLPERPRARRFTFAAHIELVDMDTEAVIQQRTCDMSLFGCFVKSSERWPIGKKVRLKISYKGSAFKALGCVVHTREIGMGIHFAEIAPKDEVVLEIWMAELRNAH